MKAALGILFAAALLAVVVLLRGNPIDLSRGADAGSANRNAPRPSSEVVLSIEPGARRGVSPATTPASAPALSPLMQEYAKRREYKTLYDGLKALTARTPEQTYVLAQILDNCANVTDRKPPRRSGWKLGGPEARARFAASLAPRDPGREKRLAAFDRINVDPCAGIEGIEATDREIRALFEQAAATDPKAKAALLVRDLEADSRDGRMPSVSDAQRETIRQVMASGDPRALVDIVSVFGLQLADLTMRTGPDEAPLDYSALHGAATLAACELGYPCGPDSRFLLEACALSGHCDAANYRDYWFYYYSSPSTSQLTSEYHLHLMRVIRSGDWSYFTFHRGAAPMWAPFERR